MLAWGLAQFCGAVALLSLPALPHPGTFILATPLVLAATVSPRWRWLTAFWLGAALAAWQADRRLDDQLDVLLDGEVVEVTGRIIGLVDHDARRQRFRFRIESGEFHGRPVALPREVRLAIYDPLEVAPGERWRWKVKLRRPRGFANPGGFDYERWLFAEGLGATGYVRELHRAARLDAASGEWRAGVAGRFAAVAEGPAAGLLRGLATGDRGGISVAQWDVLRLTGTAHLMAISGLHIALVAGLALALASWLRRRLLPGASLAWPPLFAGTVAGIYGALAGFDVPVQRALVAAAIVLLALGLRRRVAGGQLFGFALAAVLLLDPLAPLDTGFWLSFGAVAAILFTLAGRRPAGAKIAGALAVQAGLFVLMAPLVLASFGRVPLLSPLANLVAIPVFDGFVVPLVLLGLLLLPWPEVAGVVLAVPARVLEYLFEFLELLADADLALTPAAAPAWTLFAATAGLLLLAVPRAVPARMLALWLLLPAAGFMAGIAHQPPPLAVHFLDVGQGLAVVVETPRHTLVYDTGPKFGDNDAAAFVVVPFLEARGRQPDIVMVSHGDNDHAGGLATVAARFPRARLTGRARQSDVADCAGMSWEWDSIEFRVLHPSPGTATDNDASCVLRIRAGDFTVLLTGDIEAAAEARLVRAHGSEIAADVALVPHHGSRTSSSRALVKAIGARLVISATGHGNQWGFPRPDIVKRWRDNGAVLLDTGAQGCISIVFDGETAGVSSHRATPNLWRVPPVVNGTWQLPVR